MSPHSQTEPRPLERCAFHESSHATLAHHLGVAVSSVTLRPKGLTTFVDHIGDDLTALWVFVAGIAGEQVAFPATSVCWEGSDRAYAERAAFDLTAARTLEEMDARINAAFVAVSEILVEHWRKVERLAFSLLTAGSHRLEADDVRRLVGFTPCRTMALAS